MMVTVMPIAVDALGTDLKGVEKKLGELDIRGRIKTTALLKSARIKESWRFQETCYHSNFKEKLPIKTGEKKQQ